MMVSSPQPGSAPRRFAVLMPEPPLPATHGGRVDRLSRLRGLRSVGVELLLLTWTDALRPLTTSARSTLEGLGIEVVEVARVRRPLRYAFGRYPGRFDSFLPASPKWDTVLARISAFQPTLLLADGIEVGLVARAIRDAMQLPLVYRSQNVEHVYWREQGRLARGRERLPFLIGSRGMQRAEVELRESADIVLDISEEDRSWWRGKPGHGNALVLPPLWIEDAVAADAPTAPEWDISFTGGLYTPNNVDGLVWFVRSVVPEIAKQLGRHPRVVFAGSSPSADLLAIAAEGDIACIANPESLAPYRHQARVLVNPVRFSSGVNMKMIDMLASERPIVSTTAGAKGLPSALRAHFEVQDDAHEFAASVVRLLRAGSDRSTRGVRAELSRVCGLDAYAPLMALSDRGRTASR